MILQRLVEYYDRLTNDPSTADALPKPGYSLQKISFCVVLEADGSLQQFQPLLTEGAKKPLPRQLLVPGQSKSTGSGLNPCFLWDNSAYMLGFKLEDPKPERTRESFEEFCKQHLAREQEINSPAYAAVCNFLRSWSPEKAAEHAEDLKNIVGHFGVFRLAAEQRFVHDDPAVLAYWAGQESEVDAGVIRGMCLVTGDEGPIARIHKPKIKGVRDAQSAGALLVSFNDTAYESFGKEQSYIAPVGVGAAFKYTNALNYLLARSDRRATLGDATVAFWASEYTPLEEGIAAAVSDIIFDDAPDAPTEDRAKAQQVRLFFSQLREGHASVDAIQADSRTRFYALGLSPNASRISVRFWVDCSVAEMKQRLAEHVQDMELIGQREDTQLLWLKRIVDATGRALVDSKGRVKGYDADAVSPLLSGAIARAIFTGGPYPAALLGAMVNRFRADGVISHVRVAAVKAFLARKSRLQGNLKEVPVALDPQHPSPAYHCGRLLCLLDYIQGQAIGNVNAGLVKKFYGIASAQPTAIFGRLIALTSKGHLHKLDRDDRPGFQQFCERQLQQVLGQIDHQFPKNLDLVQQGEFALGFYHQKNELPDTPPRYAITTQRGDKVRSKSEASIADMLYSEGIDYHYELPLSVPGRRPMKPDFTILNEVQNETLYIEHLGLSDNPKYMEMWEKKLQSYRLLNILPIAEGGGTAGKLLYFVESRTSGIDTGNMKQQIMAALNRGK